MTDPSLFRRAARLPLSPLAPLGRERVDQPQCQRRRPVPPQIRHRVQQGHVRSSDHWIAHFRMERHAGHKHAIQRHLVEKNRTATKFPNLSFLGQYFYFPSRAATNHRFRNLEIWWRLCEEILIDLSRVWSVRLSTFVISDPCYEQSDLMYSVAEQHHSVIIHRKPILLLDARGPPHEERVLQTKQQPAASPETHTHPSVYKVRNNQSNNNNC